MSALRGFGLFLAGIAFGAFMMQPSSAQGNLSNGLKLNHVGISVKDMDESVNFYTKTMGYREAFTVRNPQGKVAFTYIQLNRDTFLELMQSTPERPVGISHFGIEDSDVNGTVAKLHQAGIKVNDAAATGTKAIMTSVTDPSGVRFELAEFPPDSLQRKAMDAWK
jgi:catechol 2,3-dioxygenase-like lactoylglutathione lyase family enzyme